MPHRGGRPLTRLLVAGLTAASVVTPWVGADATSTTSEPTWTGVGPANVADTLAAFAPTTAVSGLAASGEVGVVAFSPSGATVFAAGGGGMWWGPYSYAGVMRSLNGGQTWTRIDAGLTDPFVQSLWVDPTNPSTVLAGTSSAIFRSTDDETTWSRVEPTGAQFLVASGDAVYAGGPTGVFSSSDAGASWQLVLHGAGENGSVVIDPAAPLDAVAIGTARGLVVSSDGGLTWSQPSLPGTTDGSAFFNAGGDVVTYTPSDPSTVYAATADGVFVSHDAGATWSKPPWPIAIPSLVVVDPTDPNTIIVGSRNVAGWMGYATSGSLFITHDGGTTWATVPLDGASGYPSSAAFDPVDSSIVLVSMSVGPGSGGGVLISRDGGATFERDDTGLPSLDVNSPVAVISDVIGVAVGGTPIFATATAGGVFASTPTGPWVDVTGNLAPPVVADLAVANQELYAATYGAGVQATPLTTVLANATSAASTPTIPRPPAAGSITGLVVDGRGHPLGRACVIVSPSRRQTTTSAVGRFTIAHLTLGVYELTIDARGCRRSTPSPWPVRHRSDVHVRPDAATVVRVRL